MGTKYSRVDQVSDSKRVCNIIRTYSQFGPSKLVEDRLKKIEGIWSA